MFALTLPGWLVAHQLNSMPSTSLEDLSPGSLVKVSASIAPGQGVVISGYGSTNGNGQYVWTWTIWRNFNITDGTSGVLVLIGSLAIPPHAAPHTPPQYPYGELWQAGDKVALVGNVVSEGGSIVLQATHLASSASEMLLQNDEGLEMGFGGVVIGAGFLGGGVLVARTRNRLNEDFLKAHPAHPTPLRDAHPREGKVDWIENTDRPSNLHSTGVIVAIGALLAGGAFLYGLLNPNALLNSSMGLLLMVGGLGVPLLGGGFFYRAWALTPIRIGTSEEGLHLEYRRRVPMGGVGFVPWDEMKSLETSTQTFGHYMNFRYHGKAQSVLDTSPAVSERVLREYKRHPHGEDSRIPIRPKDEPASPLATATAKVSADLDWDRNSTARNFLIETGVFVALSIGQLVLWSVTPPRGPESSQAALYAIVPPMMAFMFGFFWWLAPRDVAVDHEGFHVRYRSRRVDVDWSEITQFNAEKAYITYETRDGVHGTIQMLGKAQVRRMKDGHERATRGERKS